MTTNTDRTRRPGASAYAAEPPKVAALPESAAPAAAPPPPAPTWRYDASPGGMFEQERRWHRIFGWRVPSLADGIT